MTAYQMKRPKPTNQRHFTTAEAGRPTLLGLSRLPRSTDFTRVAKGRGKVLAHVANSSTHGPLHRHALAVRHAGLYSGANRTSLGVTLYELLTLRPVFDGKDRHELLRQIAFEEPRPPRRLNRAIPVELETVVLRAIAKDLAERFASARDLADDLRRLLQDRPVKARRASVRERLWRWCRRVRHLRRGGRPPVR